MPNPVDKDFFWKERLEKAGGNLRLSVYETSKEDWEMINQNHEKIINQLCNKGKVLDAGCGYGRMSVLFPKGRYVGIDSSESFIERARAIYPDKKFVCQDLKGNLPFKNKQFEWVICVSLREMIIRELGTARWLMISQELKRVGKNVLCLEYSRPREYMLL